MRDFWSDLHLLHDEILSLVDHPEKWDKLNRSICSRGQLLALLADLVTRGHIRKALPEDIKKMEQAQKDILAGLSRIYAQMKKSIHATESYQDQRTPLK